MTWRMARYGSIGIAQLVNAGLLVLLTMLVLWLMTGSVVLPVKAVVMNLLTVGVSLGAIRLTLGRATTSADIDRAATSLVAAFRHVA